MQLIHFEASSIAAPFSDEYVAEVENEIGINFPAQYLQLMRRANGGRPIQHCFALGNDEKIIERFLSFVDDYKTNGFGVYDIEVVWSQVEDGLEEGVCPFAAIFAGDLLCFDGRREGEPSIVVWDHEHAAQGKPSLTHVADNFDEFSEMLKK